jgi:hypothetical protein
VFQAFQLGKRRFRRFAEILPSPCVGDFLGYVVDSVREIKLAKVTVSPFAV